jgi:adenylate cyclase
MPEHPSLVIAFADVCGSTGLFERYGDVEARRLCARLLDGLAAETVATGGRVIKTIGDEVMCAWETARPALDAARAMHRFVQQDAALVPYQLAIRVGVHAGPALVERSDDGEDVFGDAVNVAARAAAAANAHQTLTTGDTLRTLSADAQPPNRFLERTPVRGRQQPVELFEILLHDAATAELTQMHGMPHAPRRAVLRMEYAGRTIELDETRPSLSFGRGDDNDIVIQDQLVSRNHVRLLYRKGRFVVSDSSTNGTGISTDDGRRLFLHRDEITLYGSGRILPGRRAEDAPGCVIRYRLDP